MSMLPALLDDEARLLSSRQLTKAKRAQASTELAVFNHGLEARALAEIDRLDSEAVADASRAALGEEMRFVDDGLGRAGQSATNAMLVARHVEHIVTINERRITRRFGG